MKIKKYKVEIYARGTKRAIQTLYIGDESSARAIVSARNSDDGYLTYKYIGEVLFEAFCANCEKEINEGDDYLKIDEKTRYCNDCYQENITYYYTVGGEVVADENDGSELYDSTEKEVWVDGKEVD